MTVSDFILVIRQELKVDINKNIEYKNDCVILHSDDNFNFFKIFVFDLLKSGLHQLYNFIPIGTSEDSNIYIDEKYYKYLKNNYAVYNEKTNDIILYKFKVLSNKVN